MIMMQSRGNYMDIKRIGIIGAGQMGHGIALISAMKGIDVVMHDIEERFVEGGLKKIDKFMARSVEKGKMSEEDKSAALARVKGTTDLNDLKDCDI